jgi:hypothetical protein
MDWLVLGIVGFAAAVGLFLWRRLRLLRKKQAGRAHQHNRRLPNHSVVHR